MPGSTLKRNKVVDHYDTLSRWGEDMDAANRRRVAETLALVPDDVRNVLDVGCGDGAVSHPLLDRGRLVTGIDISQKALQFFRGNGLIASIHQLPFPSGSFDLVITAEVLEHVPEPIYSAALSELERVAGKYIIVTTPNQEYLPSGFVRCARCACMYHKNLHVRSFDRASHRTLFTDFNLVQTVEIETWMQDKRTTWFEQTCLGAYKYKESLTCPVCGHTGVERPRLTLPRRALMKGVRLLRRAMTRRDTARWLASLYERANVVDPAVYSERVKRTKAQGLSDVATP